MICQSSHQEVGFVCVCEKGRKIRIAARGIFPVKICSFAWQASNEALQQFEASTPTCVISINFVLDASQRNLP